MERVESEKILLASVMKNNEAFLSLIKKKAPQASGFFRR
jgi:hypothetical protein